MFDILRNMDYIIRWMIDRSYLDSWYIKKVMVQNMLQIVMDMIYMFLSLELRRHLICR